MSSLICSLKATSLAVLNNVSSVPDLSAVPAALPASRAVSVVSKMLIVSPLIGWASVWMTQEQGTTSAVPPASISRSDLNHCVSNLVDPVHRIAVVSAISASDSAQLNQLADLVDRVHPFGETRRLGRRAKPFKLCRYPLAELPCHFLSPYQLAE
jgi:hypothetical protein